MSEINESDNSPRVIVFAGPNGAGKSSHATAILAALDIPVFVNADLIARGLVGSDTQLAAFAAGKIMLKQLSELAAARSDFAFESTLASRTFAKFLRELRASGYRVSIFYFGLTNAELALARVARRVAMGGHSVPEDDIRRRFKRSRENFFELYIPLAHEFTVFDNSIDDVATVIAQGSHGAISVLNSEKWQTFSRENPTEKRF
jgi:predicted ABC-type ATPase